MLNIPLPKSVEPCGILKVSRGVVSLQPPLKRRHRPFSPHPGAMSSPRWVSLYALSIGLGGWLVAGLIRRKVL